MNSRLTPLSRLLIVLVILAALFFLIKKFVPSIGSKLTLPSTSTNANSGNTPATSDPSEIKLKTDPSNASGNKANGTNASSGPVSKSHFDYTSPAPVGGKLKGVVELGSTGFNSFIITVDRNKNWKLEKADFGTSLVYEKLATDQDIRDGLKKYIADMLQYGVSSKDIHFVISSGAQKVDITAKIMSYLKNMGYVTNPVTATREGQLGFECAMPQGYNNDAFVVDIGSANTKISWKENGAIKSLESPGSKYFQNNLTDEQVYATTKANASQVPSSLHKTCFIIGGTPFDLAKQVRVGKERFTVLAGPGDYTAKDAKTKSGLNIYKAIADATDCQQFVFDWDANFTIGFLLGLPY